MATLPSSAVSALLNVMASTNGMKTQPFLSSGSFKTCETGQAAGQTLAVPY